MELLNSLLDNFWPITFILIGLVILCIVLYVITIVLMLFGNTVIIVIGTIVSVIFGAVIFITKVLSVGWSILVLIKILQMFM